MSYDDRDEGYWDGLYYKFPAKTTQEYIDGWWDGKESSDSEEELFLVYDMENEDE